MTDRDVFTLPPMKVTMTAEGTVTNPDGSTQKFTLKAEKPLVITEEGEENGDNAISGS